MSSRSYSNLLDLGGGDFPSSALTSSPPRMLGGGQRRTLPRNMTVAGLLSEIHDDDSLSTVMSDVPSSVAQERVVIVGHMLPLNAEKKANPEKGRSSWSFSWDEDSLFRQLKDGLPTDTEMVYIGCLKVDVHPSEQEEVAADLLHFFNCVPAFLPTELRDRFYLGFCKQQLWPLFHYMLPLTPDLGGRFDRTLWQAYVSVNKIFADKVMEVLAPEDDYVWVHDYHLMVLPTFLRKRCNRAKLGFFLHSPFPSSEIYRTLPVREEILRALLNSDVIGFHTFDYARHFLSCCSRMLGLEYESKRGYIGLEYYGRTVNIKIMPVGIHMGQLQACMNLPASEARTCELEKEYGGKIVLLGVDDMDIFKGIGLKLQAMEQLLVQHPELREKVVMVQIANPARGRGKDVLEVRAEVYSTVERINKEFGTKGHEPVVLIERHVPLFERVAFYTIAECCIVTAVRDGMNLIPYEYIISRQGKTNLVDSNSNSDFNSLLVNNNNNSNNNNNNNNNNKKSMLVVSEFIGCSPSLSGAIRINPWNTEAVAEAINMAITTPEAEKQMRHEKHCRYISTHDVAYWAQSFIGDMGRTCKEHSRRRCWGIGFGLSFRVVALDPNFRKLSTDHIVSAYKRTTSRAILLDYDGTMMPQTSVNKTPSAEILSLLNTLCNDPNNAIFIVSGRGRESLSDWFSPCQRLGIAAEHGFFYRWHWNGEWETSTPETGFEWKQVVEPVMKQYTESTDGSFIEAKESALVWHHQYADPDFGAWQAKEMLDHLESVLANEPVSVKSGQQIVEVKPQGVSKGFVAEMLLSSMVAKGKIPDFILCLGDDRSDEDMFESITSAMALPPQSSSGAEVFACTVGQKPSKAKYYLDDTVEVLQMLRGLASASEVAALNSLCSGIEKM